MTQLDYNTLKQIFQEALEKDEDIIKVLVKKVLQNILEAERDDQIGVERYDRNENDRLGSRNGYKPRSFKTRVGKLDLKKPQIREFPFHTSLFENYQRSEKALLITIQQMVLDGVSTNKVKKILNKLSPGLEYSKSSVSRFMVELEPIIQAWRKEGLEEHYEYIFSDGTYFYVRDNNHVVSIPLLVTCGVDSNGYRKVLGVDICNGESEETWREHIINLKKRGFKSANLTISDQHPGLVKVLQEEFSGVPHQRCMVHFERNLLSKIPSKERNTAALYIKQIYNAPDKEMAMKIAEMISNKYQTKYPRFSKLLNESVEETLSFYGFPEKHRKKIRTTNLIEGVINKKLKQRSKIINIFPNKESCLRLMSTILMEIDEEWRTSNRKYMEIEEDKKSLKSEDNEFLTKIKNLKNKKEEEEKKIKNEMVHS